ncbi:hypothetical protein V8E51_002887 [Hyaloscypha variabilis]
MPSHLFKSIMKVLVIHLNVTTGQGNASLTDVVSLLASKLASNGAEAWLVPTMSNILTCIRASHHPAVYDSLFDAYVAVSRLLDLGWNRGMVVPANNIKLRSIRDEIVTLMEAMTFREAEIYTGRAPEVIGTFPAATRAGYTNMDPYEVLGLQNQVRRFPQPEWKRRFLAKIKQVFENDGLKIWFEDRYPPSAMYLA